MARLKIVLLLSFIMIIDSKVFWD